MIERESYLLRRWSSGSIGLLGLVGKVRKGIVERHHL
jgi:hypothetical protein